MTETRGIYDPDEATGRIRRMHAAVISHVNPRLQLLDVAIPAGMPVTAIEDRRREIQALQAAVYELAVRADDLGLASTWMALNGVDDQIGMAFEAIEHALSRWGVEA